MNEKERMLAGLMYDATDKELEKNVLLLRNYILNLTTFPLQKMKKSLKY